MRLDEWNQRFEQLKERKEAEKRRPLSVQEEEDRAIRYYLVSVLGAILLVFGAVPVHAAGQDPLAIISNLSDFIFGAIRAVGIIMLGFGVVQIGLSLKSHDASQRANGLMTFFGGVLIAFAKNILDLILG